jgi:hypothetical protein
MFICTACNKTCKNKGGLTLHRRACAKVKEEEANVKKEDHVRDVEDLQAKLAKARMEAEMNAIHVQKKNERIALKEREQKLELEREEAEAKLVLEKMKQKAKKERVAAELQAQKEREAAELQAKKEREAAELQAKKEREAAELQAQKEREAVKLQAKKEREAAELQAKKERYAAKLQAIKERDAVELKLKEAKDAVKIQVLLAKKEAIEKASTYQKSFIDTCRNDIEKRRELDKFSRLRYEQRCDEYMSRGMKMAECLNSRPTNLTVNANLLVGDEMEVFGSKGKPLLRVSDLRTHVDKLLVSPLSGAILPAVQNTITQGFNNIMRYSSYTETITNTKTGNNFVDTFTPLSSVDRVFRWFEKVANVEASSALVDTYYKNAVRHEAKASKALPMEMDHAMVPLDDATEHLERMDVSKAEREAMLDSGKSVLVVHELDTESDLESDDSSDDSSINKDADETGSQSSLNDNFIVAVDDLKQELTKEGEQEFDSILLLTKAIQALEKDLCKHDIHKNEKFMKGLIENRVRINRIWERLAEHGTYVPDVILRYAQDQSVRLEGSRKTTRNTKDIWIDRHGMVPKAGCECCGRETTWDSCEKAHVVSQKADGTHEDHNIMLTCRDCNQTMGPLDAVLYRDGVLV